MLFNPPVIALIMVSVVVTLMLLAAAGLAVQILMYWDIGSGSERQLILERRTYLVSTLLTWVFASELISLMLFIYNAESMSGQFVGAMCATGVLNVNAWGWPALFLKLIIFFSGAVWLAINHLDNQGFDFPLVKVKYLLLLIILPLVMVEAFVQLQYFLGLKPNLITSCCGSLFSSEAEGVVGNVSSLLPSTALLLFYGAGLLMMLSGTWFLWRKSGGWVFSSLSVGAFIASLAGMISYVALYVYEHPHHHCPFCVLKPGHDYAGYALYLPLFAATALALATGAVSRWKHVPSLSAVVESNAPRLAWLSMMLYALFFSVATFFVLRSSLVMAPFW
ncbi:MAG: hypothetical protein GY703_25665 [Gammaproteobacteria bacterium]|nr:hypothetical protein [Gammaproteobacteria bacterium]